MRDRLEARGSPQPQHQHPAAEVEQKPDEEKQEQEREETHLYWQEIWLFQLFPSSLVQLYSDKNYNYPDIYFDTMLFVWVFHEQNTMCLGRVIFTKISLLYLITKPFKKAKNQKKKILLNPIISWNPVKEPFK